MISMIVTHFTIECVQVYSEPAEKMLVEMMVQNMLEYNDTCDWWTGATDLGYEVSQCCVCLSVCILVSRAGGTGSTPDKMWENTSQIKVGRLSRSLLQSRHSSPVESWSQSRAIQFHQLPEGGCKRWKDNLCSYSENVKL